ncbi:AraC family transcriptional regulator [Cohnella fermenti]|uniref:Helix-turn-helix domain-containing protein n=1 Tax=Cohnella fermenti TaxID=2565925 RepID=A0A4V3WG16_9BACL|nr:AraC family transcriptional regulator [Cohnella fermenti]THF82122.1 helix-turn-helix domain-containing protein [Cohnella fermenti]
MSAISAQYDYDFHITRIGHVTERSPNPDWKFDRLSSPDLYVIAYCTDGEALYVIEGAEITVRKGDLLFFPKGLVRSARSRADNPWSFYSVSFDVEFLTEPTRELFDRFGNVMPSSHLYKLPNVFTELNLVWSGRRSGYTIKCKSILMDIVYAVVKEQDRSARGTAHYNAIEGVTNLILTNYKEHYSIDELAELAGLSSSHFRLLFKQINGMTPIQYQHHIRIHKAKDLLLSGDCNVTEASLSVGFQDIYYFSRLFKKLTGEPPSAYIRR